MELCPGGYDEWYVFEDRVDLGQVQDGNISEETPQPGELFVFTNFPGFLLHDPKEKELVDLFWEQLDRIKPASYIADGCDCLSFVTSNAELFEEVRKALAKTANVET